MLNVAVVFGGNSVEREVSVISGLQVLEQLDYTKYKIFPVLMWDNCFYTANMRKPADYSAFDIQGAERIFFLEGRLARLKGKRVKWLSPVLDVVLPVTHGGSGENGALQGMLEVYGFAQTSSNCGGMAVMQDKYYAKSILRGLGYPVVEGFRVTELEFTCSSYINAHSEYLAERVIAKPANLGSSIGITTASDEQELKNALDTIFRLDDAAVIERYIADKTEYNCACFRADNRIVCSSVEEPVYRSEIYNFNEKYLSAGKGEHKQRILLDDNSELACRIKQMTAAVYNELSLSGIVRIDYIYSAEEDKLFINELNGIPGSLAYYLFDNLCCDMTTLLNLLIDNALTIHTHKKSKRKFFASSVLSGYGSKK